MSASEPEQTAGPEPVFQLTDAVDLHTHSTASDGADTPSQLIEQALALGLKGIALSDHDTVSGIPEFLKAAEGKPIIAVPAVEISTSLYDKEVHILGLFIDPANPDLNEFLSGLRDGRRKRNELLLEKLQAGGYAITREELLQFAGGESVGRLHFAKLLVSKGYFSDTQKVFERCLRKGAPMYTPRVVSTPQDSIRAIHQAGGYAVWAHPIHQNQATPRQFLRKFVRKMLPFGLDGIEVNYSMFSPLETAMTTEVAETFQLLRSGGSDYHGDNQRRVHLGTGLGKLRVPYEFLRIMLEKRGLLPG